MIGFCDFEARTIRNINVYGVDERELPQATTFTTDEKVKYGGIAQMACKLPNGNIRHVIAFHLTTTVLTTTAHSFVVQDKMTGLRKRFSYLDCDVHYRSSTGADKETPIKITRVYSRWDTHGYDDDWSNDMALLEIAYKPLTLDVSVRFNMNYNPSLPVIVDLVGFHGDDILGWNVLRRTSGIAQRLSTAARAVIEGAYPKNPESLFIAQYDSTKGTSGAPVFKDGKIVGLNSGGTNSSGNGTFDEMHFNFFIVFDNRFNSQVGDFLTGRSPSMTIKSKDTTLISLSGYFQESDCRVAPRPGLSL